VHEVYQSPADAESIIYCGPTSGGSGIPTAVGVKIPEARARREETATGSRIARSKAMTRVLVVEDCEDILFIFQLELTALGYAVDVAASAADGIKLAEANRPDVIVSDLYMPGVDGFEFIRRIRQMPGLASAPAVALTGFSLQRDTNSALAAGFTTHLTKPVDLSDLAKLIEHLTNARVQQKAS
jgi:two-component system CheB/CheR fusion protein